MSGAQRVSLAGDQSAPSLGELVADLGGVLHGSGSLKVRGVAPLESALEADLCFLSHAKYAQQLAHTRALAVIVAPAMVQAALSREHSKVCIETDQPYLYFAKLTQWWKKRFSPSQSAGFIHPSAVIDPSAQVHVSAHIGALCVVGAGVRIGAGCVLHPRVSVLDGCSVGESCIIHSGAVIGADGFGFAPRADKSWEKIEQLGAVVIGNDVEIGANTCIDRGALQDTVIEDGVKLDNLVQIGHNVRIGANSALAGCAGVAGSATIGERCTVGGGAVVLGHLTLADDVHISASTTVTRSISKPGLYSGIFPLDDNASWEKNAVSLKQLAQLRERVRRLEGQLKTAD